MPKVSIITPTYNRAHLVGRAIQSVINQTYSDWELLVVDDGSADDTKQVVTGFGERVHYIRQENAGACAARNTGFAASQGEYIVFLDSDDEMLPHNLEILVGTLDSHPENGVAYGWGYFCHHTNGQRELMDYQRIQGEIPPQLDPPWEGIEGIPCGTTMEGQILPHLLLEDSMLLGENLIRRACVEAIGGFNTEISYMEHWDFFLRLAQAGFTYVCARQAVMLYNNHEGNRFRDRMPMLEDHLAILNRIFADSTWQTRLASIRNRAYFFAYYGNVLANFAYGSIDQGTKSLNAAIDYAPMTSKEIEQSTGCIAQRVLDTNPESPLALAEEIFAAAQPGKQIQQLERKVKSLIHMSLAFREHRSNNLQPASGHALQAIRYDLSMWRNRGLVRVLVDGTKGRMILDWIRSFGQNYAKNLAKGIADRPCIFISPHIDDVVLSCGGTLAQLSKQHKHILVVSVFTAENPDPATLSPLAQKIHELWGNSKNPMASRKLEDEAALAYFHVKYSWLDFLDVIYRQPNLKDDEVLYPTFKPRDDKCFDKVRETFLQILNQHPGAVVFAPLGLGHHRDHLIVHEAIKDAAKMQASPGSILFYEDFPYASSDDLKKRIDALNLGLNPFFVEISSTLNDRVHAVKMYASQLRMLFGESANVEREILAYAHRVGTGNKPSERFWYAQIDFNF